MNNAESGFDSVISDDGSATADDIANKNSREVSQVYGMLDV